MTPGEIQELKNAKGYLKLTVLFRSLQRPPRTLEISLDKTAGIFEGARILDAFGPVETLDGRSHVFNWEAIEEVTLEEMPPTLRALCGVNGCPLPSDHAGEHLPG